MNKNKPDRWHGLSAETQAALAVRDYGVRSLADAMLTYFRKSEQVPTGIRVAGEDDVMIRWGKCCSPLPAVVRDQAQQAAVAGFGLARRTRSHPCV
jgi:redox-regulated HSP33 family molecular chaperone